MVDGELQSASAKKPVTWVLLAAAPASRAAEEESQMSIVTQPGCIVWHFAFGSLVFNSLSPMFFISVCVGLFQKNKCPKLKGHHGKLLRKKALRVGKAEGIPAN
jgi:hypothetical protein